MPSKSLREELLASVMDKYDHFEPDPIENPVINPVTSQSPKTQNTRKSSMKPVYVNEGLDTTQLYVPMDKPRSTGQMKLVLDNQPIPLDDSIPTYGRTGKKDYKEVQYNKEYQPPEFTDPGSMVKHVRFKDTVNQAETPTEKANKPTEPRRSARLKDQARTKWKPNRNAQLMLSTVANVFLVSNCIHAEPVKPLVAMENSTRIHQVKAIPLSKDDKDEKLRAYHARLDVLNCIFQPQEDIYGWQVEHIDKHLIKKEDDKVNVFFKVIWFGGNKQWVHMDDLRLHDPFLLIRYALKHKLRDKPGWEWTKHYVESNPELTRMVKLIKFHEKMSP